MIQLTDHGVFLVDGEVRDSAPVSAQEARQQTMAWNILQAHNTSGDPEHLKVRFDAMVSHDITYVGIIQQARASGMKEFPIPYALTNCHNSLCAVGGTINEDDHMFGQMCIRDSLDDDVPSQRGHHGDSSAGDKAQILEMLLDLGVSADLVNQVFLADIGKRKRHHCISLQI